MNKEKIMKQAIDTYGTDKQTDMMLEEMAELAKALLKFRRLSDFQRVSKEGELSIAAIREEMADVRIMLDQMEMIYGDYSQEKTAKLVRLNNRLKEEMIN
ncbi:MAG: hypothetical protein UGF45_13290 [Massilioclostridium sp.]|nr:hypothetical protein [Massilioclostridium sp.]MEE1492940.1 hypothetical protein [Massilioclostridium sp.]